MSIAENDGYLWFARIVAPTGTVFITSVTIYHIYRIYSEYKQNGIQSLQTVSVITGLSNNTTSKSLASTDQTGSKNPTDDLNSGNNNIRINTTMKMQSFVKFAHILTFISILFQLFYALFYTLHILGGLDNMSCYTWVQTQAIWYHLSKLFLYLVLYLRLQLLILSLQLNKKFESGLICCGRFSLVLIILYGIISVLWDIILSSVLENNGVETNYDDEYKWCNLEFEDNSLAFYFGAIFILLDFIICIVCVYLFVKPLFATSSKNSDDDSNNNNNNNNNSGGIRDDLLDLIVKYCLITCLALITSFISVILVLFNAGVFIIVDNCVNCVALILLANIHNKFYLGLCGNCCHSKMKQWVKF